MTKDFLDSVQEIAARTQQTEDIIENFHEEDKETFRAFAKMFQHTL